MTRLIRASTAALALLAVVSLSQPAFAVPCAIVGWSASIDTTTPIDGVPADGALVLQNVFYQSDFGLGTIDATILAALSLTVTDPQMTTIPGQLEWRGEISALVWRPDSPLAADTTYDAVLVITNSTLPTGPNSCGFAPDATVAFQFVTNGSAPTPVTAPTVVDSTLTEVEEPVMMCCPPPANCDPGVACPGVCFASEFLYHPVLQLSFTGDVQDTVGYRIYQVEMDGSGEVLVGTFAAFSAPPWAASLRYDDGVTRTEYCAVIEAINVLDDSTARSEVTCIAATDLVPIMHNEPSTQTCDDPLPPDQLEPTPDSAEMAGGGSTDDCDCSVRSHTEQTPLDTHPWALAFAALGWVWMRRRR